MEKIDFFESIFFFVLYIKQEEANKLFALHIKGEVESREIDLDVAAEFDRQRTFLERSMSSLKKKLEHDMSQNKRENMRIMQQNVELIKEINALRRKLKSLWQFQKEKVKKKTKTKKKKF